MTQTFERLVSEASRGNTGAIDALLARHIDALHAFVRMRAGEVIVAKESTADVVQSVCRQVLEDMDEFEYRGETAFRGWLFTRALHKIVDRGRHYRRQKRDAEREVRADVGSEDDVHGLLDAYATMCTPSRVAMGREQVARMEEWFGQLPEDQREAIALSRIAGLSYAEIGEQMDRSETAVRGLVARGLTRLSALATERDEA